MAPAEQEDLLADYIPWARVVRIPKPPPTAPACRDPFDAAFLHLAAAGKAHVLVSGDKEPLALAGAPGVCPVTGVDAFCRQVLAEYPLRARP